MTTRKFPVPESVRRAPYPFPEPPPPDDPYAFLYLSSPGYIPALISHFGRVNAIGVFMSAAYVSLELPTTQTGLLYPDLLIAFDIDREAIIARQGFVIAEQGKPPDFVLEIGSDVSGDRDVLDKRIGYASLGIPEYWRFDPSGGLYHHGAALAGDRLVNGRYEPYPISRMDGGGYRGYSPALNLELRWENGNLLWYDPAEQSYLPSFDDLVAARKQDKIEAERDAAETREMEAETREMEAETRELEAETRRLRNSARP